jgi:primary-amine oxidase
MAKLEDPRRVQLQVSKRWPEMETKTNGLCREGMVLSHITYDDGTNGTRPLFYRLSVAEMVVPVSRGG